jgi:hypothetical protein
MSQQPAPGKPINPGDCFFVKEAFDSTKIGPGTRRFQFPGWGFGMFMGALPPLPAGSTKGAYFVEPNPTQLFIIMGSVGFITFDDIARFIGPDKMKECLDKFEEKYLGKKITPENGIDHEKTEKHGGLILPIERKGPKEC